MLVDDRPNDLKTLAAFASLFILAGCRASAQAVVAISGSGRGSITVSVTLDREAAARIGNLNDALRVSDLERAGWVVVPSTTAADGSVTASVRHPFANPAQASSLLGTLGPVHLSAFRRHGLLSSTVGITGDVDLRAGVDAFGDPALDRALGVPSLAATLAQLQANGAAAPDVSLTVAARLPARSVTWTIPLGQQLPISAAASSRNIVAAEWFLAAIVLVIGSAATATMQLVRRRHGRHHDHWTLARV